MCGIAGYIGQGDEKVLRKMSQVMNHRGPDSHGEYVGSNFGLAHARLSIVDLTESGRQPMLNHDESISLVFNGEIYNYQELRKELENGGYKFKGTSDTEVILALYQKIGEEVFSKIHGMFAIGIVDVRKDKLILARDRAGKKPLYWANLVSHTFVFASELSALSIHPAWNIQQPKISRESLAQYVVNDYVPTPATIFEGVYKLEPATCMTVSLSDRAIHKRVYWSLSQKEQSFDKRKLEILLSDSVQRRLVADVPVGVFLSGGLDSSAVAYYAARHVYPSKIKTFSIGFNEKSFDESEFAQRVADQLGTEHYHKVVTASDCKESIKDIFHKLDEPVGDASIISTYIVSKFARQHVTVALGGDGGDELFAGYPTFFAESIYRYGVSKIPQSIIKSTTQLLRQLTKLLPFSYSNLSLGFKLQKFIDGCVSDMGERHARYLGTFSKEELPELFVNFNQNNAQNVYRNSTQYIQEYKAEKGEVKHTSKSYTLNALLYMYFRTYLMDEVLVKVDRATMMNSLEARSPLLDTSIIEYAFSLPYSVKKRYMTLKWALKEAMRGKLPDSIIFRKKKGFGLPISEWLNHDMKYLVDQYLNQDYLAQQGLFNSGYVQTLVQQHQERTQDNRKKLWTLLAFQLWWDSHMGSMKR